MNKDLPKLTLDQPVTYQIKVPGIFDENKSGWDWGVSMMQEADEFGLPVTVLVATVDQAALHSLLRKLYTMGIPLISLQLVGRA